MNTFILLISLVFIYNYILASGVSHTNGTCFLPAMTPAQCGLALSYVAPMLGCVDTIIRSTADMETQMVKSERVIGYTKLEPEAELTSTTPPPQSWPEQGNIQFNNVSFSYTETGGKVLKDLSLTIDGGAFL